MNEDKNSGLLCSARNDELVYFRAAVRIERLNMDLSYTETQDMLRDSLA